MSNLGFTLAMQELDINVIATAVGDRYVLEAMREQGFTLGGEQSGHVILSEFATTGDGVLTALHLLNEMKRTGKSATALANIVKRLPQILVNVKNVDKLKVTNSVLETAVKKAETELGKTGRVLLRPSGTEPLIRVMVEAATQELAQTIANGLAQVVEETCTL
jgi:phosphoglucosamine mutase